MRISLDHLEGEAGHHFCGVVGPKGLIRRANVGVVGRGTVKGDAPDLLRLVIADGKTLTSIVASSWSDKGKGRRTERLGWGARFTFVTQMAGKAS